LALDASDHNQSQASAESDAGKASEIKQEIVLRLIDKHDGRCISPVGDSTLAEFTNAVEAIHCAVEIQQAMLGENKRLPLEQRVLLRIGLHIGNVVEENGSLLGDGIDTAIGLEELAVPGGICLSSSVYEQVKHKGHVGIEFAGEKKVKNVLDPVAIYQVVEPGVAKGALSLWEELKRRNVFRVGVAYTVVAWLLIQVADVILSTFDSPRWVMQTLVLLLILGFPIALVLAWVYELTPVGLKRSDDVLRQTSIHWLTARRLNRAIISLLVIAVVFLVYENYVSKGLAGLDDAEPISVAVLPFENLSVNAEDEFFADGLADELLSALGRIHELKVASRTASFYYKDKDVDVATIASTLMVDNVLSGSVRRDGEQIRVTAALDDTVTDDLLWSETYDKKLEAILDIQSDIAQSVTTAIVPVLSPESHSRIEAQPTKSAEAYQYYLRGRDYLRQPAEEVTLDSAIGLFDRAIDLDRRFAHAYAGLCEAHLGAYEFASKTESFEAAELACHRALTLDDSLWEVHVALGNLYRTNGQLDSAVIELETAIDQQPNAVSPYLALAETYAGQNRVEQAEATYRRAEEVEAGYWGVHRAFGNFLYHQSRYDEAIERHLKVIKLVPDSGIGYDNLGTCYLSTGEFAKAESAFNASPLPSRWTYMNRGLVYKYRGEFAKAVEDQKRAIDLAPQAHTPWGFLGDAYRFIEGEEENAAEAYDRAIQLAEQRLVIDPTDWRSVGKLGMYYAYAGRPDEALAQVEKLLELRSDSTAYYYVTRVRLQVGDIKGAYEALERAVEGGWSRAQLASDPDVVALRGETGYAELLAEPQG
jgi:TolB-like protein/tetratricopeptide (TPR) repeat protein